MKFKLYYTTESKRSCETEVDAVSGGAAILDGVV